MVFREHNVLAPRDEMSRNRDEYGEGYEMPPALRFQLCRALVRRGVSLAAASTESPDPTPETLTVPPVPMGTVRCRGLADATAGSHGRGQLGRTSTRQAGVLVGVATSGLTTIPARPLAGPQPKARDGTRHGALPTLGSHPP